MKIKTFLLLVFAFAGLVISLFTAVMTYLIIDQPIGFPMVYKISLTVLVSLPLIGFFAYFIGLYLTKKFTHISSRLDDIHENKFLQEQYSDKISDITEIHNSINHLSSRLEESISSLQENNQNLSSIIKSLSHDIKTPLTIINGYLEEFEDGLVREEERPKIISILKKETAYLNELSSDVIGYIQSQELVDVNEKLFVKEFVHKEVCPIIRVNDGVELKCEISKHETIEFNSLALKKILVNLVHNASKYTKEGSITLKAEPNRISVEDTGTGIKMELSEQIFEPFRTLDKSRNRENSGFGLGLSIARNLAESNGFELFLDTTYVGGCRFVLRKSI